MMGCVDMNSDYKHVTPIMTEPFGPDVTMLLKNLLEQVIYKNKIAFFSFDLVLKIINF
jgi:hypothetical protein